MVPSETVLAAYPSFHVIPFMSSTYSTWRILIRWIRIRILYGGLNTFTIRQFFCSLPFLLAYWSCCACSFVVLFKSLVSLFSSLSCLFFSFSSSFAFVLAIRSNFRASFSANNWFFYSSFSVRSRSASWPDSTAETFNIVPRPGPCRLC